MSYIDREILTGTLKQLNEEVYDLRVENALLRNRILELERVIKDKTDKQQRLIDQ